MTVFSRATLVVFSLVFVATQTLAENVPMPRTGVFDLETSLEEIVEAKQAQSLVPAVQADGTLTWNIMVPKKYNPENPPGVFVYISPTKSGTVPYQWRRPLDLENLIYISAHDEGNFVPVRRRMSSAVLALTLVQDRYKTNDEVLIISGFSGGARTTSLILENLPGIFTGALFIGGAYDWKGDIGSLQDTLSNGAFVFLTGSRDSAQTETKSAYWQYTQAGLQAKLIDIKGLPHRLPKRKEFQEALKFLREGLTTEGPE